METVRNELNRPPLETVEGFRAVLAEYSPSCLVTDARRRVGAIGGLLPVKHHHKIAGPALTVNLSIDDLVDCMPVLAQAQPGDVIVVACHGTTRTAMWGGLMSTLSRQIGVAATSSTVPSATSTRSATSTSRSGTAAPSRGPRRPPCTTAPSRSR